MEILQGILVLLGLIASWCVGWYGIDFVKWVFALRFRTTDTHLTIEVDTQKIRKSLEDIESDRIRKSPIHPLTPNERARRIGQPSVYVPPPKPIDTPDRLWKYYGENEEKRLQELKQYSYNLCYVNLESR